MIKFFVSSTFSDMHQERDLIQNVIQPTINRELSEQGEYVSFIDLRWGIDTFQGSTQQKILDSCFDEIESCRPYFIVFIGGRYGWVPDESLIRSFKEKIGSMDEIRDKSITELEVMFALRLNQKDLGRCLFYIKEDAEYESEDARHRILALRQKIETVAPSQIRTYKSLKGTVEKEALVDSIVHSVESILQKNKQLSWQERAANAMEVNKEQALPDLTFSWLNDLKSEYDVAVIDYPECRQLESAIVNFCKGLDPGPSASSNAGASASPSASSNAGASSNSGSSSTSDSDSPKEKKGFWSRFFGKKSESKPVNEDDNAAKTDKSPKYIFVSVGASKDIVTTADLLRYLIYKVHLLLNAENGSVNVTGTTKGNGNAAEPSSEIKYDGGSVIKLREQFKSLLEKFALSGRELYICLLGLEKLEDAFDNQWMPDRVPNVKWIFTCADSLLVKSLPLSTYRKCVYGSSAVQQIPCAVQLAAFEKKYAKTLAPKVKSAFEKLPYANDYTMVELAFNRLAHFDSSDMPQGGDTKDIPLFMEQLIQKAPHGYEQALSYFLEDDYKRFDKELCQLLFVCMASFKRGLSVSDMEGIAQAVGCQWSELDVIRFINYESVLLCSYDDGRYDIASDIICSAIARKYSYKFKSDYSEGIFRYLSALDDDIPVKVDNYQFICYVTNHPKEYLDYLYRLFDNFDDNRKIKASFIPVLRNEELMSWLESALSEGGYVYQRADFASFLISLVADYGQRYDSLVKKSFVKALEGLGNQEGSLLGAFQRNYIQALENFSRRHYTAFLDDFETCLKLSKQEFRDNPPKIQYFDPEHKFGMGTMDDMLADKYGFAFVSEVAALMSKYADLPSDFKDKEKAQDYAQKAMEIRNSLASMQMIQPKDVQRAKDGEDVAIKLPSYLRGKAVELLKRARSESDPESKRRKFREGLEILDKILSMDEDNLTGQYKDAQKTKDYELTIYRESFRDRALTYQVMAELPGTNATDKYDLLQKAYADLIKYEKNRHTDQVLSDFYNLTQPLAKLACERDDFAQAETYLVKFYEAYAQLKPSNPLSYALKKEIKDCIATILARPSTRERWLNDLKSLVMTFQSQGKKLAMTLAYMELINSLKYCVVDLGENKLIPMYLGYMENAAQMLPDLLSKDEFHQLYDNSLELLQIRNLSEQDSLCALNTMFLHAKLLGKKGEFDNAQDECDHILHLFEIKNINSASSAPLKSDVTEFLTHMYLENNKLFEARGLMEDLLRKYRQQYESHPTLSSVMAYANALLNQVIMWDKEVVDEFLGIMNQSTREEDNYRAQQQLEQAYSLLRNFKENSPQKALLMRRIKRSLEIVEYDGLGFIASKPVIKIVEHFKNLYNELVADEKGGRHQEYVKKLKELIDGILDRHFLDIYFTADWFATLLYLLGQNLWREGQQAEGEKYYTEAYHLRKELDEQGIPQNTEFYANLLALYAELMLQKPNMKENLNEIFDILSKAHQLYERIEPQLNVESLNSYASCCFNFGQFICMFTSGGKQVGLPVVKKSISILERLVNQVGRREFVNTLNFYKQRYMMLSSR